jgi:hypothetical protein
LHGVQFQTAIWLSRGVLKSANQRLKRSQTLRIVHFSPAQRGFKPLFWGSRA